jgi:tRNA-binding protein
MQATNYAKETLVGMQVICVVNLPPRNIAGFMSEVLTLGVKQADGQASMLTPSLPAKIGTRVY